MVVECKTLIQVQIASPMAQCLQQIIKIQVYKVILFVFIFLILQVIFICILLRHIYNLAMDSEDRKLNLLKLKRLIDSGISSIPVDNKYNSAVLVIGDTGVGKTTILSFLAKRKLYIKIHGLNTILDSDDRDGLKIGHDRFSQTRVPAKIIIDHVVFFDCSGFKDNRGQEFQISNSFFVQRLFDIYKNIKILLIIDESSVSEARADKLPKLIRNLLKSFNTLSDIQDGVILLINKAKPEYSQKIYSEQLLKMAKLKNEEGYLFNQQERNFIQFLVKNKRVCLFKQAQKEDEGKVLDVKEENLLNLIRDTHFVKSKKIKNIISQSAKLCIRDFIDRLALDSDEKIQKFSQQIVKQFSYESKSSFTNGVEAAKQTKKRIVEFAQNIQKSPDEKLIELIRNNVNIDLTSFEQDVSAVLFFKNIYNKSDYFFKLVRSSLASSLTKLILNLDTQIAVLEEQQKKMKALQQQKLQSDKKVKELQDLIEKQKQKHTEYENLLNKTKQTHSKQLVDFDEKNKAKDSDILKLRDQISNLKTQYQKYQQQLKKRGQQQKKTEEKLTSKDKQIAELTALMNSLKLQNSSNLEQIEMLHQENVSLKNELDFALSQKSGQKSESQSLNDSKISKSSKYPDVVCPHFKNGGQCVHCIKAWKAEQKKKKTEDP